MKKSPLRPVSAKRLAELGGRVWSTLARRKALRARNPERRAKLFERNFRSVEFVSWSKMRPCRTCGRVPTEDRQNETSHAEARGMGGCGADWTRTFTQCGPCHRFYERNRTEFLEALRLTPDDVNQFTIEHQQAWARHAESEGIQS